MKSMKEKKIVISNRLASLSVFYFIEFWSSSDKSRDELRLAFYAYALTSETNNWKEDIRSHIMNVLKIFKNCTIYSVQYTHCSFICHAFHAIPFHTKSIRWAILMYRLIFFSFSKPKHFIFRTKPSLAY